MREGLVTPVRCSVQKWSVCDQVLRAVLKILNVVELFYYQEPVILDWLLTKSLVQEDSMVWTACLVSAMECLLSLSLCWCLI